MASDRKALRGILANIVPCIQISTVPEITPAQAVDIIAPRLEGPDRHCSVGEPVLSISPTDGGQYLVWIIDLSCKPDLGFGWGEQVWVDAHTGEILRQMGTWIE
jgi:hypothetical protein